MNAPESIITLESLKAELAGLGKKIESFERRPTFPITVSFPRLNEGEKFVGVVISADGTKREAIILLPGERENINWDDAVAWAKSIGGELPDRVESALLFTMKTSGHLAGEFKDAWYWTREPSASDSVCAWGQGFTGGYQSTCYRDDRYRARAVRRLEIL